MNKYIKTILALTLVILMSNTIVFIKNNVANAYIDGGCESVQIPVNGLIVGYATLDECEHLVATDSCLDEGGFCEVSCGTNQTEAGNGAWCPGTYKCCINEGEECESGSVWNPQTKTCEINSCPEGWTLEESGTCCPAPENSVDYCPTVGATRCVIGGDDDNPNDNWVAECSSWAGCGGGYWHAIGWYGDSTYNSICTGDALTPTPWAGWPTPGDLSPTPIGDQCQTGEQNRDQDMVLICNCDNGCTYREDPASNNGGGWGWVCEEDCKLYPIGTPPRSECNQVDFVHSGTSEYCGVSSISCPDTCRDPNITPPIKITPPIQGPSCNSISLLDANSQPITGGGDSALRPGDAIKLKCGASASVNHYEFRVTAGGTTTSVANVGTAAISGNYIITSSGAHSAQCRICTGTAASTCQAWETL